ncbi:MAG: hypothetical protein H0V17_29820 [Deltaproteobacteria bacterium]|nr:hypothetical protein [Deltaproteobacteria bacterium]
MRKISIGWPTILVATLGFQATAAADKRQVRYVNIHPVAKSDGGGMCQIEGPHVHVYEADKLQYRDHHGANFFVGDPVAYGYDGPKKSYKGHHPIHVHAVVGTPEPDVEFCYLDGAHFHAFAPPPGPEFQVAGDAHFYVAEPPPVYLEARPAFIGINAIYTPIVYTRPRVIVEPPVGWIGIRAGFGGGVHVGGPGVVVATPGVFVKGPKVKVKGSIGVGIYVPPPPSINVNIGVGIGVGGGYKVKGGKRGRR